MAGVKRTEVPTSPQWMTEALANPKRKLFREDIRHLYGLLRSPPEDVCSKISALGGVYDWRMVRQILGENVHHCSNYEYKIDSFIDDKSW